MNKILLEETCVLEYIKYSLADCISKGDTIEPYQSKKIYVTYYYNPY